LRASLLRALLKGVLRIEIFDGRHYHAGYNGRLVGKSSVQMAAQPLLFRLGAFSCRGFSEPFQRRQKT
jgi:hypothetical protein